MTRAVDLPWPGGEHAFRLGLNDLRTIQQKTDCGPEFLLHKLKIGQWYADELYEVLRVGLIGAGMNHVEARKLVQNAMERDPLIGFKVPAMEVLSNTLFGPADDPVGEDIPVEPTPEPEKTASGNSAPITD
ncbi:gene transfer agent family protein [Paracoccus onubensis]|uniref:Gene transfer agent family protein n=1 Tax=Paracoccus onubensis TaxID=1675788 RepID=A0A418T488_9RHOB|nr:gene transfer agent family protein [Paracoccus onubensis]RJE87957.1 gene transfer agent family protein [Paracoccus onubensis]